MPGEWLSYQCFMSTQEYSMCGGGAEFAVGIRNTSASAVQGMSLLSQLNPEKSTKDCACVAVSYDCAGVQWWAYGIVHLISSIRSDKAPRRLLPQHLSAASIDHVSSAALSGSRQWQVRPNRRCFACSTGKYDARECRDRPRGFYKHRVDGRTCPERPTKD